MNIENIKALAKKMRRLRHEEHYSQEVWIDKTSCGTAACLAGHAALMAGAKLYVDDGFVDSFRVKCDGKTKYVEDVGRQFLGLTAAQAEVLFSPVPTGTEFDGFTLDPRWPEEYAQRWEKAKKEGTERPSRIAADLLDAVADGKVKLRKVKL